MFVLKRNNCESQLSLKATAFVPEISDEMSIVL